jgi:hypothetical protein
LPAESFAICSFSSVLIRFMGILRRQRLGRAVITAILYGSRSFYAIAAVLSPFWRLF